MQVYSKDQIKTFQKSGLWARVQQWASAELETVHKSILNHDPASQPTHIARLQGRAAILKTILDSERMTQILSAPGENE